MSVTAKCNRCKGSATADTFEEASKLINHAIGLSRSIPCGRNYGCVVQVGESKKSKTQTKTVTKTDSSSYKKVEGKSSKKTKFDESKSDTIEE